MHPSRPTSARSRRKRPRTASSGASPAFPTYLPFRADLLLVHVLSGIMQGWKASSFNVPWALGKVSNLTGSSHDKNREEHEKKCASLVPLSPRTAEPELTRGRARRWAEEEQGSHRLTSPGPLALLPLPSSDSHPHLPRRALAAVQTLLFALLLRTVPLVQYERTSAPSRPRRALSCFHEALERVSRSSQSRASARSLLERSVRHLLTVREDEREERDEGGERRGGRGTRSATRRPRGRRARAPRCSRAARRPPCRRSARREMPCGA